MSKVQFEGNEFDSFHEATCAALFNKYGWQWEQPKRPLRGWLPDFLLKGDTPVYVECKGSLKWDDVKSFGELQKYENAISGSSAEVLLIPGSPRRIENRRRRFTINVLGFLFDGSLWSYAELGSWSGRVGFSHSGRSWKDRMSGENVKRSSSGDGQPPDIELDWRLAESIVSEKRVSFFRGFYGAEVEEWEPS